MKNYTPDEPVFSENISITTEGDLVNADNDSAAVKQLLGNTLINAHNIATEESRACQKENDIENNLNYEIQEIRRLIDLIYANANGYTDNKIAQLINGAPSTLDTLGEIAKSMQENDTVVNALEEAIGSKANAAEFDSHETDSTKHITDSERAKWNDKQDKTGDAKDNTITFTSADTDSPTSWTAMALFKSGEKLSSLLNKVSIMAKNIRYLNEIIGTTDISGLGGGTVTGALDQINDNTNGFSFGYDKDGNPGYIVPGDSEVIPFGKVEGEVSYDSISWEKIEDGGNGFVQNGSQYESVLGEENILGTFTGYSSFVINNPLTSYIEYSLNFTCCKIDSCTITLGIYLNDVEIFNKNISSVNTLQTCSLSLEPGINTIKLYHTLVKTSSVSSSTVIVVLPSIVLNKINTYNYAYWKKISDNQDGKGFIEEEDGIWWARGMQWNEGDLICSTFEITVPKDMSTYISFKYSPAQRAGEFIGLTLFSASFDGNNFFEIKTTTSNVSQTAEHTISLSQGTHHMTIGYNIVTPKYDFKNEYINITLSPVLYSN